MKHAGRTDGPGGGATPSAFVPQATLRAIHPIHDHLTGVDASSLHRLLDDTLPVLAWTAHPGGQVSFCNARWLAYTGLTAEEVIGDGWTRALHPDDVELTSAAWSAATRSGEAYLVEQRLRRHDGDYRWFLTQAAPLRDAAGKVILWSGACTDIHEKKLAEQALRDGEERLARVLDSISDALYTLDHQWRFTSFNRACERYFERTREEVIGRTTRDAFPRSAGSEVEAAIRRAIDSGESQEIEVPSATRPDRCVEMRVRPFAEGVTVSFQDTTQRRQVIEALRQSNARFAAMFGAIADAVILTDPERRIVMTNPGFTRMFGYEPEEVLGQSTRRLYADPADYDRLGRERYHAAAPEEPGRVEVHCRRKDGSTFWTQTLGVAVRANDDGLIGYLGVHHDITEQREVEASVRESEARYRTIFHTAGVSIWEEDFTAAAELVETLRRSGVADLRRYLGEHPELVERAIAGIRITEVNEQTLRLLGASHREQILGSPGRVFVAETRETFIEELVALAEGRPFMQAQSVLATLQGERRDVLVTVSLPPAQPLDRVLVSLMDITEQKRAERQLRELNATLEQRVAQRTALARRQAEQLRQLALELTQAEQRERRRVAMTLHDHLQQILAAAKMRVDLIAQRLDRPELRRYVDQVDELIAESINASRTLAVELSPPVLHDRGLPAALEWLARHLREKQGLEVAVQVDPAVNPEQEEVRAFVLQAVQELLFNVKKHAGVAQATVTLSVAEPGMAQVEVVDRGRGCDPDSDRSLPRAEGFGLTSIRQRIDLLGGRFVLDARPGNGCRVALSVPLGSPPARSVGAAGGVDAAFPGSSFRTPRGVVDGTDMIRVLLVDDHRILREGLAGLLQEEPDIQLVGQASDGRGAVELAQQLRPDIVIMDVSMPVMDGVEATRRITEALPTTRVIGLSMHEKEDLAAAMTEAGASVYLTKGGPSEALMSAIRSLAQTTS